MNPLSVLGETDSSRLFTEALTAEVESVLADETGLVSAETALTATLAVLSGAREPNGVVGHFGRVGCLEEESFFFQEVM